MAEINTANPELKQKAERSEKLSLSCIISTFIISAILTIVYLIFMNYWNFSASEDFTNLILRIVGYLVPFITIIQGVILIIKVSPKLGIIQSIGAYILTGLAAVFLVIVIHSFIAPVAPVFVIDGKRDLFIFELSVTPDDILNHDFIIPEGNEYENDLMRPFMTEGLISLDNIYIRFTEIGMLNKNIPSYPLADNKVLNSLRYDDFYWLTTQHWNNIYRNELRIYFNNTVSNVTESKLTRAIDLYHQMNVAFYAAKEWSLDNAAGVCPNLLALIARNHAERAHLLTIRGGAQDSTAALEEYMRAIETYSVLYRMLVENNMDDAIQGYNIYFWIASAFHNMANLLLNSFPQTLSDFSSATAFFTIEHDMLSRLDETPYLRAYSRYFSALTSHKVANMILQGDGLDFPRELKYYLRNASDNYLYSINDSGLRDVARAHSEQAYEQILDIINEYLDIFPDERGFFRR